MAVVIVPTLAPRDGTITPTVVIAAGAASAAVDCGPGSGMVVLASESNQSTIRFAGDAATAILVNSGDMKIGNTESISYPFDARTRFFSVKNLTGGNLAIRWYVTRLR